MGNDEEGVEGWERREGGWQMEWMHGCMDRVGVRGTCGMGYDRVEGEAVRRKGREGKGRERDGGSCCSVGLHFVLFC